MKRPALAVWTAIFAAGMLAAQAAHAQYERHDQPAPEDGGGGGSQAQPSENETPKENQDVSCPSTSILAEGDHMTVFDGAGRDVTNILYQARLSDAVVECKHRSKRRLDIDVKAVLGLELGLAAEKHEIEVPYFVAVIDPEQLVVTKQAGTATVKIERDSRTGAVTVEPGTLKLVLESDTLGNDLEVVVGLQLTKEQLDYNRAGH